MVAYIPQTKDLWVFSPSFYKFKSLILITMIIGNNSITMEIKIWKSKAPLFKIDKEGIRFTVYRYIIAERTTPGYDTISIDEISNKIIEVSHFNDEDLYDREYLFSYQHLIKEDNPLLNNFLEQKQKEVKQTIKELVK